MDTEAVIRLSEVSSTAFVGWVCLSDVAGEVEMIGNCHIQSNLSYALGGSDLSGRHLTLSCR